MHSSTELSDPMYDVMMDRFEYRKKHFKRQVNDMIDGLFDEMLTEFTGMLGQPQQQQLQSQPVSGRLSSLKTPILLSRSSSQLNFSQRLNELLPETITTNGFSIGCKKSAAPELVPSTSGTQVAQAKGHHSQETKESWNDSSTNCDFSAFLPVLDEPEVKLEIDESMESEGQSQGGSTHDEILGTQPNSASGPSINLRKRKVPEESDPTDESSQEELPGDGSIQNNDGKYVGTLALKCWIAGCGLLVEGKHNLDIHLRTVHKTVKPYRCISKSCNMVFKDRSSRGAHIRSSHNFNAPLDCSHCGRTFKNPTSLTTHVNLIHEEGLFNCTTEGCIFVGPHREVVRKHIRIAHPRFICSIVGCGKSFNQQSFLEAHQRKIHASARPFRCVFEGCPGYAATRKGQVVQHIRMTHFGLPLSVKRQKELGLEDERDPYDYIQVIEELL